MHDMYMHILAADVLQAANNDKGRKDAEAVAAGYELTVGTTESLCRNFVAPNLTQDKRFCITQEFGTVPTIVVGKVCMDRMPS